MTRFNQDHNLYSHFTFNIIRLETLTSYILPFPRFPHLFTTDTRLYPLDDLRPYEPESRAPWFHRLHEIAAKAKNLQQL